MGEVVSIEKEFDSKSAHHIKPWHRRQAMQLAAMLPDDTGDQMAVLVCIHQLITSYLNNLDQP